MSRLIRNSTGMYILFHRRDLEITFHATNWTFGFWTARFIRRGIKSSVRHYGIDLGPVEIKFNFNR